MRTIVYKKINGIYELTDIEGTEGDIRVKFEEPTDGKLIICERVFTVKRGISNIKSDQIESGEIHPKLYTGALIYTIEGFIMKDGAIIRKNPDAEYARRLSEITDSLSSRITVLENQILEIMDKIERKIIF